MAGLPGDANMMAYMGKELAGTMVTISGLKARPELNGTEAKLLNWHSESERWMVECAAGERLRLRHENLIFPSGVQEEQRKAQAAAEQEASAAAAEAEKNAAEGRLAQGERLPPAVAAPPHGWKEREAERAEWRAKEPERQAAARAKAEAEKAAKAAKAAETAATPEKKASRTAAEEPLHRRGLLAWLAWIFALLIAWLRAPLERMGALKAKQR